MTQFLSQVNPFESYSQKNLRVLCSVYCSFEAVDVDIPINCLDSDISGLNAEFDVI